MFSITTFGQLLKGLPRGTFDKLVAKHHADKHCKRFNHWKHLVTMMYAQLSGTASLRTLEAAFNSQRAHHHHLGADRIRRTTLAEANENRPDTVFAETAGWLMNQLSGELRKETRDLLYLLDSTSITLKGRDFDRWTQTTKTRRTQGIKLHVLLNGHHAVPVWQAMSAPNVNDVELAHAVSFEAGAMYVFDKGYCDYNLWHRIAASKARFVTRFKTNAAVTVERERKIPRAAKGIVIRDEIVRFKYKRQTKGRINLYDKVLRRITVERPDKPTPLVLATNDLTSSALELAQRYRERWGIELFFKWIKQHLKIKHFLGRSENAVRIQLLTALISYLLVAILRRKNAVTSSMWEYLCELRATLLQRTPPADPDRYRKRRAEQAEMQARQLRLI
jgi:IS4 transposase